jgi:hypothetical protein
MQNFITLVHPLLEEFVDVAWVAEDMLRFLGKQSQLQGLAWDGSLTKIGYF